MKRRRRHRVLKRLGLLACATLIALWIVSLRYGVSYFSLQSGYTIGVGSGAISLDVFNRPSVTFAGADGDVDFWERWLVSDVSGWPWFRLKRDKSGIVTFYLIPLWIPLLAAIAFTATVRAKNRRLPANHCQTCGYDLTGNEAGRCPECGAAASQFRG
ncbi:MAG TPA: hypothetical protein P5572_00425 [Phycisphaerae bacterium]|nr:hypothetical protein [Phycisphaerales bacterium]HRX83463.1 hypothetical protein [Phycisphaerae bacterium]